MSTAFDEPTIPAFSPRVQRMLLAGWISLGVHAALIALVQVAPPATTPPGEPVIEVRLVSPPAAAATPTPIQPPAVPVVAALNVPPKKSPRLLPSEVAEALPVARPDPAPITSASPAPAPIIPAQPVEAAAPDQTAPAQTPPPAATLPPAAALTSAVDLTYYSAREVDVHPRALGQVVPDYPPEADRRHVSGKLLLQLKLQADGRVSDLEVLSASPPGVFEASALQAFRTARFTPAQRNGRPVRALVQIEVVYDWEGQMRR